MKRLLALAAFTAICAAPAAWAQPAPTTPAKKDAATSTAPKTDKPADTAKDAMTSSTKAGPEHKKLEWFAGEWQAESTDLTSANPSVDKGTMTCKMVMGGRFVDMDYDGRYHGQFFKGGGYMGYNAVDKKYESVWVDSGGTAMSYLSGSVDSAGKVYTLTGDWTDPASGKKGKQKEVITITGKDTYKSEFFAEVGGKETKWMEISYTRGGAAKPMEKTSGVQPADKAAMPKTDAPKSK